MLNRKPIYTIRCWVFRLWFRFSVYYQQCSYLKGLSRPLKDTKTRVKLPRWQSAVSSLGVRGQRPWVRRNLTFWHWISLDKTTFVPKKHTWPYVRPHCQYARPRIWSRPAHQLLEGLNRRADMQNAYNHMRDRAHHLCGRAFGQPTCFIICLMQLL